MSGSAPPPDVRHVAIVGAGLVGLSTAWHLLDRGLEVTVLEGATVGAGASAGNAGWITPDLVEPLPSPTIVATGLRDVVHAHSPVGLVDASPQTVRFLLSFVAASRPSRRRPALAALEALARTAVEECESLGSRIAERVTASPVLVVFESEGAASRFLRSHEHAASRLRRLSADEARDLEPTLSDEVAAGFLLDGQRHIDPARFTAGLARAFVSAGGTLRTGLHVTDLRSTRGGVEVIATTGDSDAAATLGSYDLAVVAAGVDSAALVGRFGVSVPLAPGRGYGLDIPAVDTPRVPVYIPERRLACTPLQDRFRVVGIMDLGGHRQPHDPRRVQDIVTAASPYLRVLDDARARACSEWVGSRPLTADGLPLIGPTGNERVHVATGHGMWGITLGPVTGRLLADAIADRRMPSELAPFSPTR